ncbi:cation:proton antiporter [Polymorphospora rubra]|uniref:cation:proton antiporter n=1 Tax=Polymorphospora rubra TaxID=338584 RepID=UPI00340C6226
MELELAVLGVAAILIIVTVAYFAPRIGVAAPIALVLVGIGCSYLPGTPELVVDPDLILMVVLPPILYSAAVNVPASDFRRNFKAISSLAVLLVLVSAFAIGFLLHLLLPDLGLAAAVALGAVVSPPDAVAATSIGKRLGLPPRLVTVLEGEGLVNDATALVMLRSAVAATAGVVSFWGVLGDFVIAVAVGLVIGLLVGLVTVQVRARVDEPVLNTAISFAVPFLAFIPAEELHASGVLAVVVAGLVTGHQSARHFTAQARISDRTNWRTIQLLLENGVFLLMGFEITTIVHDVENQHLSVAGAVAVGLAVTAVLVVVRIAYVVPLIASLRHDQRRAARLAPYLETALARVDELQQQATDEDRRLHRLTRRLRRKQADASFLAAEGLGWRGGVVIGWSGMRGVVTLAAAQSLPADLPYRPQLILIAFTVAIVTLIGQGGTLPLVIRKLRIRGSDADADRRELASLIDEITTVGGATLDNPDLRQATGQPFDPQVVERVRHDNAMIAKALAEPHDPAEPGRLHQRRELRRLLLQAAQAALLDARASGVYSSRALEHAQIILDNETSRLDTAGPRH